MSRIDYIWVVSPVYFCNRSLLLRNCWTYLEISHVNESWLRKRKNINQNENVNHGNISILVYVSDDWWPNRFVSNRQKAWVIFQMKCWIDLIAIWNNWWNQTVKYISFHNWEIIFLHLDLLLWSDMNFRGTNQLEGHTTLALLLIEHDTYASRNLKLLNKPLVDLHS